MTIAQGREQSRVQLEIDSLACRRGGRTVFSGVSLSVQAGDAVVVTGRNGAGKSTLLAALAGLLRPASGTIRLTGSGDRALPECVHHLGHREGLKSALTAGENLRASAALLGSEALAPDDALARVGLAGAGPLPAGYLSAGQRRRVTLARLLIARRPIWLLDEPTTALDGDGQAMLAGLLSAHLAEGGLLVAASHNQLPLATFRELRLRAGLGPADPGQAS